MAMVGFIGLGNMGAPMAGNLLKAQHRVSGHDIAASAVAALADKGGHAVSSVADTVAAGEVVITMLPAGPQVREVYLGPNGVLAHAQPGALLIDCSTIDVETARAVAVEAAARGLQMIDAPVSGGTIGAESGTLTFMVGGPAEAFARAEPILRAMGRTIIHAGPSGSGQAAKICNNMMLAAVDDRSVRGLRASRKARAFGPNAVRYLQQIDQPILGDDRAIARCPVRSRRRRRTAITPPDLPQPTC